MAGIHLAKDQRRRLIAHMKSSKPDGWRQLLKIVDLGPSWKAYGIYYQCVYAGTIDDKIFTDRMSVDGMMPTITPAAMQSEKGLVDFLASIQQKRSFGPSELVSDPAPSAPLDSPLRKPVQPPTPRKQPRHGAGTQAKDGRKGKENKRTISLMIEPSLYDQVRVLAEIQDRSIGAQVRHAVRQDIERNAHLLYDPDSIQR